MIEFEIYACPHCGSEGKAVYFVKNSKQYVKIECENTKCRASSGEVEVKEGNLALIQAAELWNKRV